MDLLLLSLSSTALSVSEMPTDPPKDIVLTVVSCMVIAAIMIILILGVMDCHSTVVCHHQQLSVSIKINPHHFYHVSKTAYVLSSMFNPYQPLPTFIIFFSIIVNHWPLSIAIQPLIQRYG